VALLKRKAEKTTTIAIRVPESVKQQLDAVKQLADSKGFDLSGSLTDAVIKWIRQAQEEIAAYKPGTGANGAPESFTNGGLK
jgi:hypothetical protein